MPGRFILVESVQDDFFSWITYLGKSPWIESSTEKVLKDIHAKNCWLDHVISWSAEYKGRQSFSEMKEYTIKQKQAGYKNGPWFL